MSGVGLNFFFLFVDVAVTSFESSKENREFSNFSSLLTRKI